MLHEIRQYCVPYNLIMSIVYTRSRNTVNTAVQSNQIHPKKINIWSPICSSSIYQVQFRTGTSPWAKAAKLACSWVCCDLEPHKVARSFLMALMSSSFDNTRNFGKSEGVRVVGNLITLTMVYLWKFDFNNLLVD